MNRYVVARWASILAAVFLAAASATYFLDGRWVLASVHAVAALCMAGSAPAAWRSSQRQQAAED